MADGMLWLPPDELRRLADIMDSNPALHGAPWMFVDGFKTATKTMRQIADETERRDETGG